MAASVAFPRAVALSRFEAALVMPALTLCVVLFIIVADRMEELVRGLRGAPGLPGVGKPGRAGRPGKQGIQGSV